MVWRSFLQSVNQADPKQATIELMAEIEKGVGK